MLSRHINQFLRHSDRDGAAPQANILVGDIGSFGCCHSGSDARVWQFQTQVPPLQPVSPPRV